MMHDLARFPCTRAKAFLCGGSSCICVSRHLAYFVSRFNWSLRTPPSAERSTIIGRETLGALAMCNFTCSVPLGMCAVATAGERACVKVK